ncbi:protein of unknown function [Methylorubrum extorquens]|uniref:Uncharacterized protein n=1 Tax=Methylorubrum extorquens TaxID=408 RepID=A0A2N9AWK6_METEX|nr:protein of unknown function [Methylorubrum extorquens]
MSAARRPRQAAPMPSGRTRLDGVDDDFRVFLAAEAGGAAHDRQNLAAHLIVLDRREGPQQIDGPVRAQEAEHLGLLLGGRAIAFLEEGGDRDLEQPGDLAQAPGANAILALLVFLNLLEGHTHRGPERGLAQAACLAQRGDPEPDEAVDIGCLFRHHLTARSLFDVADRPKDLRSAALEPLPASSVISKRFYYRVRSDRCVLEAAVSQWFSLAAASP